MKRKRGWVDLQVNGYVGIDFSSEKLTKDEFRRACREIIASGTAVFLPTVITSRDEIYRRNLPLMAEVMSDREFASAIPGFHLEGPFLLPAPGASGAHHREWMRPPERSLLKELSALCDGKIKMLTVSADLPGVLPLVRVATKMGICVSVGHHLANAAQLAAAVKAGAKALTHLGNGLPNMIPRHPNTLFDAIAEDGLTAMIITDGHHLPPSVIKTVIRAKGVDRTVVVSDAAPVAGLPPGKYHQLSQDVVLEKNGRLHAPSLGVLAGSSYSMSRCMNYLASLNLLSPNELRKVGHDNPLALIFP